MADRKKAPENTTEQTRNNPLGFLGEAVIYGTGNAIERQEARGQQSFVKSDTLPTDMGRSGYDSKAILVAAGVQFLGPVPNDPLFQYVTLPPGWKKVATDHSMHSKLVDEKGRERAGIYYKAAFYDRSSHIYLTTRFHIRRDFEREDKEGISIAYALDGDQVIHTTESIKHEKDIQARSKAGEASYEAARRWLSEHYPYWENPGAYWQVNSEEATP